MIGLFLGIFLLVISIIIIILGDGNLGGFLGVLFVIILAIWLIITELKKKKKDRKTSKIGEKCYARILECKETGAFILNKIEYKVIVAVYVPSLQKKLILEEVVGFNNSEQYPKDSFYRVLYYNNDLNIKEKLNNTEIPNEILKILNDETVINEFNSYKEEMNKKQLVINEKVNNTIENSVPIVGKIILIYKRIIIGIIIIILLAITLFDTIFIKQTIEARNYIETTATYVDRKIEEENDIFYDAIYIYEDNQGNQHEITINLYEEEPKKEITLRYNPNNPQDYFEDGSIYNKSQITIYIVKIIALILLLILFFNKKLLNKINLSIR